jgi:cytidine deaminase
MSGFDRETLLAAARGAADHAYAPYSQFRVGAALLFADGAVVSAANVENASYGLSLCAETVAVARALADGRRGGLVAVAVSAADADIISPCGRCRQVLTELAGLDGSDPLVLGEGRGGTREWHLSQLLPEAFGPKALNPR